VNLITFALFFYVNSPDDMAKTILGGKRVTLGQIEVGSGSTAYKSSPPVQRRRKRDLTSSPNHLLGKRTFPSFSVQISARPTRTARSYRAKIRDRIGPSLSITLPMFFLSLVIDLFVAMVVAF